MNKNLSIGDVEALLFVAGDEGLSLKDLSHLLERDEASLTLSIKSLQEQLNKRSSALDVIFTAGTYKLASRKEYSSLIEKYAQSSYSNRLSQAALEILAIIAYKQPVTRLDIEDIRGVSSSGPLQKLLLHDLIKEDGRLDAPGRPILYKTTSSFLDVFGLQSLNDLSDIFSIEEQESKHILYDSFQRIREED
ncbi:MAG: SMC-Scp complex subunit ScpB [Atopococcus tabaci]|uniref:Segregation and condensation protein B n=1 Tax=Atopococcus tabaci TaxID=269774 RepID=A0AA43RKL4_9LACT|nr:SMC-Scp complex subunit ScpB [Atopococcus tabaci]